MKKRNFKLNNFTHCIPFERNLMSENCLFWVLASNIQMPVIKKCILIFFKFIQVLPIHVKLPYNFIPLSIVDFEKINPKMLIGIRFFFG